jgi:hypothetical protein
LAAPAVAHRSDGATFPQNDTPLWPAFAADLKGQLMSDNKHAHEARKAFRSSNKKAPLTEHEEKQRALLKNLERLKAERLAREAAKSKDD